MAFSCMLTKLFHLFLIYGYPAYKVFKTAKEGQPQKLWVIYFLIIGLFSIIEGTLLFPLIIILGKISKSIYPFLKVVFHLWLYYPEYRGALLLDQQFGKFIDKIFLVINPIVGNLLAKIGIPKRESVLQRKKTE